jgi:hypothetical protein
LKGVQELIGFLHPFPVVTPASPEVAVAGAFLKKLTWERQETTG